MVCSMNACNSINSSSTITILMNGTIGQKFSTFFILSRNYLTKRTNIFLLNSLIFFLLKLARSSEYGFEVYLLRHLCYSRQQNCSSTWDNSCQNSFLNQFYEVNICQLMIFRLYAVHNKHEIIKIGYKRREKSWELSQVLG